MLDKSEMSSETTAHLSGGDTGDNGAGKEGKKAKDKMSLAGVEPALPRPQRGVLTTIRQRLLLATISQVANASELQYISVCKRN